MTNALAAGTSGWCGWTRAVRWTIQPIVPLNRLFLKEGVGMGTPGGRMGATIIAMGCRYKGINPKRCVCVLKWDEAKANKYGVLEVLL